MKGIKLFCQRAQVAVDQGFVRIIPGNIQLKKNLLFALVTPFVKPNLEYEFEGIGV